MMEAAIPRQNDLRHLRIGMRGKERGGTKSEKPGINSSSNDKIAPAQPMVSAMISGRTRNPPRRLYAICRITNGMRLSKVRGAVKPHCLL